MWLQAAVLSGRREICHSVLREDPELSVRPVYLGRYSGIIFMISCRAESFSLLAQYRLWMKAHRLLKGIDDGFLMILF